MKICILLQFFSLINAAGASFCVGDDIYVSQQEENAPSPAPSINLECTSQTSNARGRYTSTVAPCTFQFHKAEESQRELDLIQFHTSDLCSEDNAFLTVREYVKEWPDECVGDFQRCYSLEHHRLVVWDFLCAENWEVPEGTTHVSVDCSVDKSIVLEATTHRREEFSKGEHDARLYTYEGRVFNLALILGACLVGLFAISNLIIKPLVATKHSCNHDVLPRSSSCGCQEVQGPISFGEEEDNESSQSISMMEEFHSQVLDFDAVPIGVDHGSNVTMRVRSDLSSDAETESRLSDDFGDSEQPMEVELVPMVSATTAIPIVSATILYN